MPQRHGPLQLCSARDRERSRADSERFVGKRRTAGRSRRHRNRSGRRSGDGAGQLVSRRLGVAAVAGVLAAAACILRVPLAGCLLRGAGGAARTCATGPDARDARRPRLRVFRRAGGASGSGAVSGSPSWAPAASRRPALATAHRIQHDIVAVARLPAHPHEARALPPWYSSVGRHRNRCRNASPRKREARVPIRAGGGAEAREAATRLRSVPPRCSTSTPWMGAPPLSVTCTRYIMACLLPARQRSSFAPAGRDDHEEQSTLRATRVRCPVNQIARAREARMKSLTKMSRMLRKGRGLRWTEFAAIQDRIRLGRQAAPTPPLRTAVRRRP